MRMILFVALLIFSQAIVLAQGHKRELKLLNKVQLCDSIFDRRVFAQNFVQVDKNYLTNNFKSALYKVACYNEVVKLVDSSDLIKPSFTFVEDSIVNIEFTRKNVSVKIVSDTSQNGLVIFENSGYEGTEFRLRSCMWKNKKREGNYYEYNRPKGIFLRITYQDGKEISRTNYAR